jgi:hypothetical protein
MDIIIATNLAVRSKYDDPKASCAASRRAETLKKTWRG